MLKPVLDISIPALVFLMMLVVGMGLTADDFRRAVRRPRLVIAATAVQFIVLPLVALLLVRALGLRPNGAYGMLLVAACPTGTVANFYAHLARADVALGVTLTAISCLVAVPAMPLLLAAYPADSGGSPTAAVPAPMLLGQLALTLLLPTLSGMVVRRSFPEFTEHRRHLLFGTGLVALAALIGLVLAQGIGHVAGDVVQIALAVVASTVLAVGAGYSIGWVGGADATGRFTLGIVFAVRNVGVSTAVAVTVLGRVEFALFAVAYFLSQTPLLLAAALVFRGRRADPEIESIEAGPP